MSSTSRASPTKPVRLPETCTSRLPVASPSQPSGLAFKTVASCYLFQKSGGSRSAHKQESRNLAQGIDALRKRASIDNGAHLSRTSCLRSLLGANETQQRSASFINETPLKSVRRVESDASLQKPRFGSTSKAPPSWAYGAQRNEAPETAEEVGPAKTTRASVAFETEPLSGGGKRGNRSKSTKRGLSAIMRRGSSCANPSAARAGASQASQQKSSALGEYRVEGVSSELVKKLFQAKCADLKINQQPDQEKRFFEFCAKNVRNRRLLLRESSLGVHSVPVINAILRKQYFTHLDLRKNQIGNEGVVELVKGLRTNVSLVSLDVGSNDVTGPGSVALFKQLGRNNNIVSLNLANTDKLHRNRMGAKACAELGAML